MVIPGGYVNVRRVYSDGIWSILPLEQLEVEVKSKLRADGNGYSTTQYRTLTFDGVTTEHLYAVNSEYPDSWSTSRLITFDGYEVKYRAEDDTYYILDYEDHKWRVFDGATGRLESFGYKDYKIASYEYADDEVTTPSAVLNSQGEVVLQYTFSDGHLTSVVDVVSGKTVDYTYEATDDASLLSSVTYAVGTDNEYSETYSYNGEGQLIERSKSNGIGYSISYNSGGMVASVIDFDGVGKYYEYDYQKTSSSANASVLLDESTGSSSTAYALVGDATGTISLTGEGVHYAMETTTGGVSTEFFYDANGALYEKRINGQQVLYREGGVKKLTEVVGSDAITTKYYNSIGKVIEEELPGGGTRYYTWNPSLYVLTQYTDAIGTVYSYTYDDIGNRLGRTDAVGLSIQRQWGYDYTNPATGSRDSYNRVFVKTDPNGNQTAYTYKGDMDEVTREYDPYNAARQTLYTYDASGNLTSTTDARGSTSYFGYDSFGHMIWTVDALGTLTRNRYDGDLLVERRSGISGADVASYLTDGEWATDVTAYLDELSAASARLTRYEYDAGGRLTRTYRLNDDGAEALYQTLTYDVGGKVAIRTNALGQTLSYGYDDYGNQAEVVTPYQSALGSDILESASTMEYDALGRIVGLTDPAGVESVIEYDLRGRIQRMVKAVGPPDEQETTYTYDAEGHMTSKTLTSADETYTTYYEYDALGRRTHVYGDLESETWYQYDVSDNVTLQTDARGVQTAYEYDLYNRLVRTSVGGELVAEYGYDLTDNLLWQRDGAGNTTYFAYDALGRRTYESVPQPAGTTLPSGWQNYPENVLRQVAYNAWGEVISTKTSGQVAITRNYDRMGRMTTQSTSEGLTLTYTYDAADNLLKITWPVVTTSGSSQKTSVAYTRSPANASLVMAVTDRTGAVTAYGYDSSLRAVSQTLPQGATLRTEYDDLGRVSARRNIVDGVLVATLYTYNALGQPTSITYPDNTSEAPKVESRAYDAFGRLTHINVDPATGEPAGQGSYPVRIGYDAVGNVTSLTTYYGGASEQGLTQWAYDARGRVTDKLYDGESLYGNHLQYAYDGAGNLQQRTDARGVVTTYAYDAYNNVTDIAYDISGASGVAETSDVAFTYDRWGRRLTMSDGTGTSAWSYSTAGRLAQAAQGLAGVSVDYLYDAEGRRTLMEVAGATVPSTPWSTVYNYDSAGRLEVLLDNTVDATSPFQYAYTTGQPLPTTVSYPDAAADVAGSSQRTMIYDALGRLLSIAHSNSAGAVVNSHGYAYNEAGQREEETLTDGSVRAFSYDDYRQLIDAVNPTSTLYDFSYAYDPIGNRLESSAADENGDPLTTTYTPTALNQYSVIDADVPAYDASGNLTDRTSDNFAEYVWDAENRLVEIRYDATDSSDYTAIEYDGLGRRVRRTELTDGVATETILYVYDGLIPVQELDADGYVVRQLTRGLDLSGTLAQAGGTGGILAVTEFDSSANATTYWATNDAGGNVTGLFDGASDSFAATATYSPFGQVIFADGDVPIVYGFSSQETHARSGLILYLYRAYDPVTGRWLNRDPIEEEGGANLYGFVENNSINDVDVFGHDVYSDPYPECSDVAAEMNRVERLLFKFLDSMDREGCCQNAKNNSPADGSDGGLKSKSQLAGLFIGLGGLLIESNIQANEGAGLFNPGSLAPTARIGKAVKVLGNVLTVLGTAMSIYDAATSSDSNDRIRHSASAVGGAIGLANPLVGVVTGVGAFVIDRWVSAAERDLDAFERSSINARCSDLSLLASKAFSRMDYLATKRCH